MRPDSDSFHNAEKTGILLVDKAVGRTSFSLIASLRKALKVKTIGHAGTLDPFATGLMVMLVGKKYTRLSNDFMAKEKEYLAEAILGISTDTYDCCGQLVSQSNIIPALEDIVAALEFFQGEVEQIPPMFSAKKVAGKKLYELARKGKTIERRPKKVTMRTELISYSYPLLQFKVTCSMGTYIRSIAHDLGKRLGCGAHLKNLVRQRCGDFHLKDALDSQKITPEYSVEVVAKLRK